MSVIVIFLDPGVDFLQEAVDSVLRQSYADLELILVDDGSTDGSSGVAEQLAAREGRVRYVCHDGHRNLGMSASRNVGLQHARGELVAFLDADDVWMPGALALQVALLDAHPQAAMVIGGTEHWRSWRADGHEVADQVFALSPRGLVRPPVLAQRLVQQRSVPPSSNASVSRRWAIDAVGGYEDAFRGLYEDQIFYFKFLLAHPVFVHETVIDRYRQHPRSAVARAYASRADDSRNPARAAFRRYACEHLGRPPWRGTLAHREARWYARWDRWPAAEPWVHALRPGRRSAATSRVRRLAAALRRDR